MVLKEIGEGIRGVVRKSQMKRGTYSPEKCEGDFKRLFKKGMETDAIRLLIRVERMYPDSPVLKTLRQEYDSRIRKVLGYGPPTAKQLARRIHNEGINLHDAGRYKEALAKYEEAAKVHPNPVYIRNADRLREYLVARQQAAQAQRQQSAKQATFEDLKNLDKKDLVLRIRKLSPEMQRELLAVLAFHGIKVDMPPPPLPRPATYPQTKDWEKPRRDALDDRPSRYSSASTLPATKAPAKPSKPKEKIQWGSSIGGTRSETVYPGEPKDSPHPISGGNIDGMEIRKGGRMIHPISGGNIDGTNMPDKPKKSRGAGFLEGSADTAEVDDEGPTYGWGGGADET
ncbi:MAG: hypothetical protein KAW41_06210 [Candidatus Diapherotrites archaeon]|nr:hypothetical protein [Candidatus Diapherotrites archaeon]